MSILPLEGVVVLEFSHTVMGPSCGVVLADLGADVIRVEPAPDGDRTRRLHGFATGFSRISIATSAASASTSSRRTAWQWHRTWYAMPMR